ncbi:hypothetical protein [Bradyrhizobium sp. SZCCHNR2026]|uniref:hypothetical protein n=1 Tax=Bradyrhizobium sp. SZCCHNR2026 TaxID=3057381 RepID=UPI002916B1A3|nr:hypothetical protein [Bradyrhizobium sp. SZCCHNR2026]
MTLAKHLLPGALVAFAVLHGAAAVAAELPTYDVSSFPATPLQLTVVGASAADEQAPVATLTRANMPATPVQLSVLTPHHRSAAAATVTTVGAARN